MNEQELLKQLNNLKNIKPDSQWEKGNRELLFNQIYGSQSALGGQSEDREAEISWIKILGNMAAHSKMIKQLSQPACVVCAIVIIVFGGGIAGVKAARNTKPGDSLYIAKIISEKTQFAVTFNEKEKAKLGLDFAGNRAREISQVIAESDKNKEAQVEKLTEDFKNEIKQVKSRLEKINAIAKKGAGDTGGAGKTDETQGTEQDAGVFSANLGKDNQRMEISEPENKDQSLTATTTETAAVKSAPVSDGGDLENALNEAEKLFNEKDYSGTLNKLNEANDIIDKVGETGESKASSAASTTGEVLGASEEAGN
ncbi:MAG: DUF5667 domain-containing protein [Candidatus Methanoperedens sp.]|nr:DUF5667 domain-containing protein [Candidatus Methanoperedens sp.]